MTWLPRVPPFQKMRQRSLLLPGKPNFRCLSCSTRKFTLPSLSKHFYLQFFSSSWCQIMSLLVMMRTPRRMSL
jgi:hypothetical protein